MCPPTGSDENEILAGISFHPFHKDERIGYDAIPMKFCVENFGRILISFSCDVCNIVRFDSRIGLIRRRDCSQYNKKSVDRNISQDGVDCSITCQ